MQQVCKEKEPLITVIVPVFNIEKYVKTCISCLLRQTYKNLEILILNDGSTDGTGQICEDYKSIDSRIQVIHKQNTGQADSRNIGIDMAQGEYLTFVDGDDFITKDYIAFLYNLVVEYDAQISHCCMKRYWSDEELKKVLCDQKETYSVKVFNSEEAIENLCYLKELNCAPCCKLYHRSIFEKIRFPIGYIYEDLACIYQTFHVAERIVFASKEKYFYFQRNESSLHGTFNERKLARVKFSEEILEFIQLNYPDIILAGKCRLFWSAAGAIMDLPMKDLFKRKYQYIRRIIKEIRKEVLFDKKAKKMIRLMAASSYAGTFILKLLGYGYQIVVK